MLIEKIMLGIALAAPIGPVSVEMIRRGLTGGFFPAFSVRLGGVVGNFLCLVGAYFGLSALMAYPVLFNTLGFLGAAFLLYTGLKTVYVNWKGQALVQDRFQDISNAVQIGLLLAIANPIGIIFWCGSFAATLSPEGVVSWLGFSENLLILVGVLIWGAGLSLVLGFAKHLVNDKMLRYISVGAGSIMVYYGLKYGIAAIERLIAG